MTTNRNLFNRDALVVIDVQKDFSENQKELLSEEKRQESSYSYSDDDESKTSSRGSLAVGGSDAIIPGINSLITGSFNETNVIYTQDAHPAQHVSFASAHEEKSYDSISSEELSKFNKKHKIKNEKIELSDKAQAILLAGDEKKEVEYPIQYTFWPDHCVQGTPGAEFHAGLRILTGAPVFKKGQAEESYSCLFDVRGNPATEFVNYIAEQEINGTLYFVGLALDHCVYHSAHDAATKLTDGEGNNRRVVVVDDATKAIDENYREQKIAKLREVGVKILSMAEVRASRTLKFKLIGLLPDKNIKAIANSFEDACDAFSQLPPADMTPTAAAIKVELLALQQIIENAHFNVEDQKTENRREKENLYTLIANRAASLHQLCKQLPLNKKNEKIKKTVATLLAALIGGLAVLGLTGGLAPILAGFMAGTVSSFFTGSALTASVLLGAGGTAYGTHRFFPTASPSSGSTVKFMRKGNKFSGAVRDAEESTGESGFRKALGKA
jgi:nicotinamidase/pyrazinamidase